MLSQKKQKLIKLLALKKHRDETQLFVAEGTKLVADLAQVLPCELLVATHDWLAQNTIAAQEKVEVSLSELQKLSHQKSPQGVIGLFQKPDYKYNTENLRRKLCLALDDVQDPGNLGTILRVADWFGVRDVFCSLHCADVFNPKTVQATMGALANVRTYNVDLQQFLQNIKPQMPIYGTFMNGKNIYSTDLQPFGIIVMGNEGNGISAEIETLVSERLLVPNFPAGNKTSESLNVSIATAVVCAEFRRRMNN